jgi:hypothetical protein
VEIQESTESRNQCFAHDLVETGDNSNIPTPIAAAEKTKTVGIDVVNAEAVVLGGEVADCRPQHEGPASKGTGEAVAVPWGSNGVHDVIEPNLVQIAPLSERLLERPAVRGVAEEKISVFHGFSCSGQIVVD